MKLKFDANLQYQTDAVNAIVDIFSGQPLTQSNFEISFTSMVGMYEHTELGLGNKLLLTEDQLLRNVQQIQTENDIAETTGLQHWTLNQEGGPEKKVFHFSIEMETGTGKTYIYLKTIFELNKRYGFKKFIIVVPSVAIREGTLKNLDITKEHFGQLYNNVPFEYFVYDSKKVSRLRQFATSNQIQILIINIDAFRKTLAEDEEKNENKKSAVNVIHQENDKLSGRKPIEFIQAANPIVIIDEPQSVDNTPKAQAAITTLNPLCTLRYSATHRNPYNLLYKLDPIKAYDMRLVKRIEVASVIGEANFNEVFIRLDTVDHRNGIKAKLTIHDNTASGVREKKITVKQGHDLSNQSRREGYQHGYIVQVISAEPGNEYVKFTNGKTLRSGESQGGMTDDVMRVQIRNTIQEHFEKEIKVKDRGIKVLSLFFIDRVANYRTYDEQGNVLKGKIAKWFEDEYEKLIQANQHYKNLIPFPLEKIHDGYFAQDKKGILKDTSGETQADEDVYSKIMKNKEQLLSNDEPLRFIFSHSALREGWDNPNVFQICTLNETASEMKKRQEIGRGLRLPVNQSGERIFDDSVNKLTVIANESYEDFVRKLQTEIEEDFGIKFGRIEKHVFAKITTIVEEQESEIGMEQSGKIWNELKDKGYINELGDIQPLFNPEDSKFQFALSPELGEIKHHVLDIMKRFILKNRVVNKSDRRTLKLNKQIYLDPEFERLWSKIKQKTTYSVEFDTDELVRNAVKAIKVMDKIQPAKIITYTARVDIEESGVDAKLLKVGETTAGGETILPDIIAYLQRETELTRGTLVRILKLSDRLREFTVNPQKFMSNVAEIIMKELNKLVMDGIKYEKIAGQEYEMRLFEEDEVVRYLNNLVYVNNSVYDAVEFESETEKRFAQELDVRTDIKLFVKLPGWFKIETPIGDYNPDWAIVKHNDKTLYLVRETKAARDFENLRNNEAYKIRCGRRHFDMLGVNFNIAVEAKEI